MSALRLVVFSGKRPQEILRLLDQVQRDAVGAQVCGVLYHQRARKTLAQRLRAIYSKLGKRGYLKYAAREAFRRTKRWCAIPVDGAIRFIHACPREPMPSHEVSLVDLAKRLQEIGAELFVTADMHSAEAQEFVSRQQADLGVVYGTGLLKRTLFGIPRFGSINLHKRKVPDYRGGGPVGLWELLDNRAEIGITVHQVDDSLDTGGVLRSSTIPIGPYDNLESLALKATVVGADLICAVIRDVMAGKSSPRQQIGESKVYRAPSDAEKLSYEKELSKRRPRYSGHRTRSVPKLLVRSIVFLPVVLIRNWVYRWKKAFPVVILYHHIITDRPHHLGTPTAEFARQIAFLRKFYRIASLEQAMQMLRKGDVPQPTVVLSFDDGYADNYVNLRAVAQHYDIPVFLFVSTGHVSSGTPFGHDRKRDQEEFAPLSWEQVGLLHRSGFAFGCHTRNHFDCGSTDVPVLSEEIEGSRTELALRASIWSEYFSFPWGMPKNMSEEALQVAKSSFTYVFAAAGGTNVIGSDPQTVLLRRVDYPATLWELELALQCVLNFDTWRNIFPYFFEPRPRSLPLALSKEKANQ